MAVIIVSDTSPLSGLAIIGSLSLLQQLYEQVLIPPAVANELARGGEDDDRITLVLSLNWIEVRQPTNVQLVAMLENERNLDRGEAEAIVLALELGADELLIDERLGRREANQRGLSIIGLLGVLLVAKRRGMVVAVRPLVDDLVVQAGFRVSGQLYAEILVAAGENE
jgi:uncharacterized protein